MRALLVVNHQATATSPRVRDVIAHALAADLKLDVVATERRGHAIDLAREAAQNNLDLVVVLGGDGTVNEVANGLVGSDTALAVVPGGSTNVFARALGFPESAVEATGELLELLRAGTRRRINLGAADGRYFTFCAGLGIDAEVVRRIEGLRRRGRRATAGRYIRTAVLHFFTNTDRTAPAFTLSRPGEDDVPGLFNAIVANLSPWTYLGERPVDPCPYAELDAGLDLFAMRSLRTLPALNVVRQMLDGKARMKSRRAVTLHDVAEFTMTADRPVAAQLDGDYLGEVESVTYRSVPDALTVIAPTDGLR